MTALSHIDIVVGLRDQYSTGSLFGGNVCIAHAGQSIKNTGFYGSEHVVSLTSFDTIVHEAPGCIAAPLVHMIATNAISIGMEGQKDQPVPVRLYAPIQLSFTTKHLSIGNLLFLTEPKRAFIACKQLTLSKSTEEEPEYFEMVKSWAIFDDMETEIVHIPSHQ